MFDKRAPEVLVIGAGPVGQFAALSLAKRGIKVQIVDQAQRPATHSYAVALHGDSLGELDQLGLLEQALDRSYRVHTVGFYDRSERRAELKLSELPGKNRFVAVTRQDVLESLLEMALDAAGVKVQWNHRASGVVPQGDRVLVTMDKLVAEPMGYAVQHTEWVIGKTREIEVPFVIGADGYRSVVRRQREIAFSEVGEADQFAVFEFGTNADPGNELCVVLDEDSTSALWPLPDGRCRWSFQIQASQLPDDVRVKDRAFADLGPMRFPVLDESLLTRLLEERAPWFSGSIDRIHWRAAVRFERRLAGRFGEGRTWLAGDASHLTGPVGAQSVNVGLREARELTGIIADILREGSSPERLDEYNRQRLAEWRALLGIEGGLSAGGDAHPWTAPYLSRLLPCIPASGASLSALAGQLGLVVG
jgi:NADPH-dependent dioxygenase